MSQDLEKFDFKDCKVFKLSFKTATGFVLYEKIVDNSIGAAHHWDNPAVIADKILAKRGGFLVNNTVYPVHLVESVEITKVT